jgi:hypothetical protein
VDDDVVFVTFIAVGKRDKSAVHTAATLHQTIAPWHQGVLAEQSPDQ